MDDYVPDFTVRPDIWDDVTKIATVRRKRHTCVFPENEMETIVSYCNNCGSPFTKRNQCAICGYDMEGKNDIS